MQTASTKDVFPAPFQASEEPTEKKESSTALEFTTASPQQATKHFQKTGWKVRPISSPQPQP